MNWPSSSPLLSPATSFSGSTVRAVLNLVELILGAVAVVRAEGEMYSNTVDLVGVWKEFYGLIFRIFEIWGFSPGEKSGICYQLGNLLVWAHILGLVVFNRLFHIIPKLRILRSKTSLSAVMQSRDLCIRRGEKLRTFSNFEPYEEVWPRVRFAKFRTFQKCDIRD